MQTTALDQAGGFFNLTTVLAHSSGEWIASDWPVCAITETNTPHRMGAALTYARRYALFTLVGIAGEDDIDAPDLNTPTTTSASGAEKPILHQNSHLNGGQRHSPHQGQGNRSLTPRSRPSPPVLGTEASAALRDQIEAELKDIGSAEEAATWAHRVLGAKSSLTAADAKQIEDAFQAKLATLESVADTGGTPLASGEPKLRPLSSPRNRQPGKRARPRDAHGIDKSELAHPEPRRVRDREHVRFVAKQPCLLCGRMPSDPHHLRFAQHRALGRKVSDEFTVPLCRGHHREVHRSGDEAAWWRKAAIDPTASARMLWLQTHPVPSRLREMTVRGVTPGVRPSPDQSNADHDGPIAPTRMTK